jgi:plastocyanin
MKRLATLFGMTLVVLTTAPLSAAKPKQSKTLGENHTVKMTDNKFTPKDVTVNTGDTVTWVNAGEVKHTATSDSAGMFDTKDVKAGGSSSPIAFSAPGTFPYHCVFHGGMKGSVIVKAPSAKKKK